MTAGNSIARDGRDAVSADPGTGFEMPAALEGRYELRVVDGTDGEQRLGLFRSTDRAVPSIEISNDRITARAEDRETIAALVEIAQANGWDRITVDGSAEFRKAVWTAATREGLAVGGYEPTFAELEQQARARDADASRPAPLRADPERQPEADAAAISEGDRRLLLTLSRHTEDRKGLYDGLQPGMDTFEREVRYERIDLNRAALNDALERALESPGLSDAFARSGYTPEALRQSGNAGEWDGAVADAIYLVRSGLHRDSLVDRAEATASLADEIDASSEDRAVAEQVDGAAGRRDALSTPPTPLEREERGADARHENVELAELFLHGSAERVAADPRLAAAMRVQSTMEQHIGEVFQGDERGVAGATLESRQMISDALRRGVDVTVREPTPVRQIEPAQLHVELER